jgi:hypothetical protein
MKYKLWKKLLPLPPFSLLNAQIGRASTLHTERRKTKREVRTAAAMEEEGWKGGGRKV